MKKNKKNIIGMRLNVDGDKIIDQKFNGFGEVENMFKDVKKKYK